MLIGEGDVQPSPSSPAPQAQGQAPREKGLENLYDARGHVKGGGGGERVANNEGGWGHCEEGEGPGGGVGTGRRTLTSGSPALHFSLCVCLSVSHSLGTAPGLLCSWSLKQALAPLLMFKAWFACFSNHQELQANRG